MVPTVYRGTKFHGTSTAEATVYRRGHGTSRHYLETPVDVNQQSKHVALTLGFLSHIWNYQT